MIRCSMDLATCPPVAGLLWACHGLPGWVRFLLARDEDERYGPPRHEHRGRRCQGARPDPAAGGRAA